MLWSSVSSVAPSGIRIINSEYFKSIVFELLKITKILSVSIPHRNRWCSPHYLPIRLVWRLPRGRFFFSLFHLFPLEELLKWFPNSHCRLICRIFLASVFVYFSIPKVGQEGERIVDNFTCVTLFICTSAVYRIHTSSFLPVYQAFRLF